MFKKILTAAIFFTASVGLGRDLGTGHGKFDHVIAREDA